MITEGDSGGMPSRIEFHTGGRWSPQSKFMVGPLPSNEGGWRGLCTEVKQSTFVCSRGALSAVNGWCGSCD